MRFFALSVLLLLSTSCSNKLDSRSSKPIQIELAFDAYLGFYADKYFSKKYTQFNKFLLTPSLEPLEKYFTKQILRDEKCQVCNLNEGSLISAVNWDEFALQKNYPIQIKSDSTTHQYYMEARKIKFHPLMKAKIKDHYCLAISSDANPEYDEVWGELVLLKRNKLGEIEVVESLDSYIKWF